MPNGNALSLPSSSQTSTAASKKPLSGSDAGTSLASAAPGSALPPRVDLEPIYDGLRAGLSVEQWIRYKEALSGFVMGRINRQELSLTIDPIIVGPKQRLHNQLLLGMYQNSYRETPPAEVAPWVLATNKATNALGGASRGGRGGAAGEGGDAKVEARVKVEVMALAGRDRRRIKEVPDIAEIEETLPSMLYEYHLAKQIKIPEAAPPQSATTTALNNKTNWEAEIKTRYTLPLASESGEFPDLEQIRMRMLPICYEEGVIGGMGDNTAHFMNVAAEVFVKEILSTVISRVRCNRPTTIKTDEFKRKMEEMSEEDDLAGERKVLGMNDLRLSFTLGDNFLTQLPLSLNKIMAGGTERPDNYYDDPVAPPSKISPNLLSLPGREERNELRGLLDECLSVGI
ncbi:transcriptional regulator of RNA polII, SAGA, subunit-domain-containing protein [Peziza echinospora]|nr:transcriptional regulator of RNA polII, SAGA, subunit-domain-containing protein [Peziza echinospora]